MKRFGLAMALLLGLFILPSLANAYCTTVSVTTSSTKVLAANDLGSNGRKSLEVCNNGQMGIVSCDVGAASNTAVVNSGFMVLPSTCHTVPAAQQPPKTFPITPNGEVDCIVPANFPFSTASISACDN